MVILEAMASGLPVMSTNISLITDVVQHGVNGLLVEPGNALGLAEAIVLLLSDMELAGRLRLVARSVALQHDWSAVMRKWDVVLQDLI
jgi:glycosyltransferase involved in cell wall biosynthesis